MMNKEEFNQGYVNESHRAGNINKEFGHVIVGYPCFKVLMLNDDKCMFTFFIPQIPNLQW